MRGNLISSLAATALIGVALAACLGVGPSGPKALAGGYEQRGYRPAPFYSAPPVYAYGPAYAAYPAGRAVSFYTTRVDIFRGPRWNYSAAYHNPRRHSGCRRHISVCGRRMAGPIVPVPVRALGRR